MCRESVQVGVGGGIGGLPAAAPDPGDRGEQDEGADRVIVEQVVEVLRTGDLRAENGRQLVLGEFAQRRLVGDTGGVEDGGDRVTGLG